MPDEKIDRTDYSILSFLQKHGRTSNVKLADHLNLSETPCWRRLKRLESSGFINEYRAILNRRKLGFDIFAFVQIKFSNHTNEDPEEFEKAVQEIPEILSCHNVTGDADYMLIVVSQNLESYEELLRLSIRQLPRSYLCQNKFIYAGDKIFNIITN